MAVEIFNTEHDECVCVEITHLEETDTRTQKTQT